MRNNTASKKNHPSRFSIDRGSMTKSRELRRVSGHAQGSARSLRRRPPHASAHTRARLAMWRRVAERAASSAVLGVVCVRSGKRWASARTRAPVRGRRSRDAADGAPGSPKATRSRRARRRRSAPRRRRRPQMKAASRGRRACDDADAPAEARPRARDPHPRPFPNPNRLTPNPNPNPSLRSLLRLPRADASTTRLLARRCAPGDARGEPVDAERAPSFRSREGVLEEARRWRSLLPCDVHVIITDKMRGSAAGARVLPERACVGERGPR